MGQVIFVAFFTLAALGLSIISYCTGKIDGIEETEERYEQEQAKKEKENDLTLRVRSYARSHKRINYNLRR